MRNPLSLKVGISGVRGIVGESFSPQLVTSFAAAFGTHVGAGPVLIGTDSRPSRVMVKQATIAGLMSVGCTPVDLGIVPIPALMLHVRAMDAFGAICISASHNPIQWNALKFVGPDGIVLRPGQFAEVTDLYHQGVYPRAGGSDIAEMRTDDTALLRHRHAVLASVDVDAIRKRKFKVVVDCCNGAASEATPAFLRELGCEVVELNTDPDEPFPHNPEPLPENIEDLCTAVRESKADIGFAQDADADRLAVVNELGEPLGEDCTVALAIRHVLRSQPGPVVVNISTSRMVDDVAKEFGCPVYRSRVGEVNVVEKMLRCRSDIGGEGNGGVIMPSVNPCRDSFVGMALLLEALAKEGSTISEMRSLIPAYAMSKEKLPMAAREMAPALRRMEYEFRAEHIDHTDGLKVIWDDRWIQARPSNTEPIIRITSEAPTDAEARAVVVRAIEALKPSTSG